MKASLQWNIKNPFYTFEMYCHKFLYTTQYFRQNNYWVYTFLFMSIFLILQKTNIFCHFCLCLPSWICSL